jgi:hypothetical protein
MARGLNLSVPIDVGLFGVLNCLFFLNCNKWRIRGVESYTCLYNQVFWDVM